MKKNWILALIIILVALFVFAASNGFKKNWVNLQVLQAKFSGDPERQASTLAWVSQQRTLDCRQTWLITQISNQEDPEKNYQEAMKCSLDYMNLVSFRQPKSVPLAQQAVNLFPLNPQAWFWLAEAQAAALSPVAVDSYNQVVTLDERNGLAWCHLGVLYEASRMLELARDAFLQCCYNRDPGVNGCLGAGRTEEKLGNLRLAIEYYRLSKYVGSLQRADELEKQLKP